MEPASASVGNTPCVHLEALSPPGVQLWAKLEWHNPTGSVKDRPAAWMIDSAERDGRIAPGDRLVEPSSGNTGISLARLARLRGYDLTVVMPSNATLERKQLLRAFGASIVESPAELGSNGGIEVAQKMAADGAGTLLFQYGDPANPVSHEESTGPEILEQVGHVDAFVAGLGTGGTLMGVGRALRAVNPAVSIVAAEPPSDEEVSGLRSLDDGYTPPIFDPDAIDGKILVRTAPALACSRRLLAEEGLFAGPSSGAALHAAIRWAERVGEGTIVVLFADAGWKYLSTDAWSGDFDEAVDRLDRVQYW